MLFDDEPEPHQRRDELARALQVPRRLYRGMWGEDGQMFATGRSYRAPLLADSSWLDRFRDDHIGLDDPNKQLVFRKAKTLVWVTFERPANRNEVDSGQVARLVEAHLQ